MIIFMQTGKLKLGTVSLELQPDGLTVSPNGSRLRALQTETQGKLVETARNWLSPRGHWGTLGSKIFRSEQQVGPVGLRTQHQPRPALSPILPSPAPLHNNGWTCHVKIAALWGRGWKLAKRCAWNCQFCILTPSRGSVFSRFLLSSPRL